MKDKVLQYSDVIVQALLGIFGNPAVDADIQQVHDYIKPGVCSAIGDLAREIGKGMEKYLAVFLQALQAATQITAKLREELAAQDGADEDKMEYLNEMISGVLDGYTGILYGLQDAESNGAPGAIDAFAQPDALQNGCLLMVKEVVDAAQSDFLLPGDDAINKAVGVVGDIAKNFKGRTQAAQIKALLATDHVKHLLDTGKESKDDELTKLSQWAESCLLSL
jgi:importin subunit beta-1